MVQDSWFKIQDSRFRIADNTEIIFCEVNASRGVREVNEVIEVIDMCFGTLI